ncbi:hypothetical protein M378DRAFT_749317 [Amanita muscaria Koide BX008]|uniref:Uncharacterized protein n=1 Tax=Amanita muscaria (strain Koide BX008) TaxID=946122 RepID=A0A0C2X0R9_AMAMK|nr:hypothetical protein M378DRAFT_749317 [Amanita muscaria Koide BX008]
MTMNTGRSKAVITCVSCTFVRVRDAVGSLVTAELLIAEALRQYASLTTQVRKVSGAEGLWFPLASEWDLYKSPHASTRHGMIPLMMENASVKGN